MDNLIQNIGKLARDAQKLAREAVQQYSLEVEAILATQNHDSRRIERCLDGMLDFCFDQGMLVLYRKLCRYYFAIDPEATVSYVHAYREMWDKQTGEGEKEVTCAAKPTLQGPACLPKHRPGQVPVQEDEAPYRKSMKPREDQ